MKVFISWSGKVSKSVGLALREWLPLVLQYVEPWLSEVDIKAGERWSVKIGKQLEECEFGIICLSPENVGAPWLLFEAGALSRSFSSGSVCPYLFGVDYGGLPAPLSQFQAKQATKESTLELIEAINENSGQKLSESNLSQLFELLWPKLATQFDLIARKSPVAPPHLEKPAFEEHCERDGAETSPASEKAPLQSLSFAADLEPLEALVAKGFADLLAVFEEKIVNDSAKERQIANLHSELQEHKRDFIAKINRPLIRGLLRLHDDHGRLVDALHRRPPEELTPGRFFRVFDGFADDIELLLAQHGVEPFVMPGEAFDPRRQTAHKAVPTEDSDLAGTIAEKLRPGFAEGDTLLKKELVTVYSILRHRPE